MSSPERDTWRLLSPYLDKALTLSDEERAQWLQSLKEENPWIAVEIEGLLSNDGYHDVEKFLEKKLSLLPRTQVMAGQILGAYKLMSLLGHGGMGSVWLAERSDGSSSDAQPSSS